MTEQRQRRHGCSLSAKNGVLRVRWREDGVRKTFGTGLPDTPHDREQLAPVVVVVGRMVRRGQDPMPILQASFTVAVADQAPPVAQTGPTVAEYINEVFLPYNQPPQVR